jgi:hypothetical protein
VDALIVVTGHAQVPAARRCCGLSMFKFNMGAKFSWPRSEGGRAEGKAVRANAIAIHIENS